MIKVLSIAEAEANKLFVVTHEDNWGFVFTEVITREDLVNSLTFCKEKLPELWENLQRINFEACTAQDLFKLQHPNNKIIHFQEMPVILKKHKNMIQTL